MTYGQTMSKIIIPQSLGRLIPPVANEFIMVLKDASLVFAISLQDITTISKNIATNEGSFIVFLPALILFLIVHRIFLTNIQQAGKILFQVLLRRAAMSIIRTEHVSKCFGKLEVLKDIHLTVDPGEVICIIGPSGAGKSTYLRSLNQLEKITSGKIFIDDQLLLHREKDHTVERIDPAKQKKLLLEMGMVFQRFNLFPHKTVLENIMLAPLTVKKMKPEECKELVPGSALQGRTFR